MDANTKDILETLNFMKDKLIELPSKSDVRGIVEEVVDMKLAPLHQELGHINRRLDALDEQFANIRGVTKEIDDIRDRVRDIERHLGLGRRLAA